MKGDRYVNRQNDVCCRIPVQIMLPERKIQCVWTLYFWIVNWNYKFEYRLLYQRKRRLQGKAKISPKASVYRMQIDGVLSNKQFVKQQQGTSNIWQCYMQLSKEQRQLNIFYEAILIWHLRWLCHKIHTHIIMMKFIRTTWKVISGENFTAIILSTGCGTNTVGYIAGLKFTNVMNLQWNVYLANTNTVLSYVSVCGLGMKLGFQYWQFCW